MKPSTPVSLILVRRAVGSVVTVVRGVLCMHDPATGGSVCIWSTSKPLGMSRVDDSSFSISRYREEDHKSHTAVAWVL